MKFYVSTSFLVQEEAIKVAEILKANGHCITCEWWNEPEEDPKALAIKELNGVKAAEVLVMIFPGRLGTHFELATAKATGIPIYMLNYTHPTFGDCIFHHLPDAYILVDSIEDILEDAFGL